MLLNNFFKINETSFTDKHNVNISLNPQHEIYIGHFPGNPVVPGVCLSQMVKEVAEEINKKKFQLVSGDNIKFTAVLNPEVNPEVVMHLNFKIKETNLLYVDASVKVGEQSFFSFKGNFKEI